MGIPDHLSCLLRNPYAGEEATVGIGHGTDWFQIGNGVCQGCILSPCLFNLYAEYIWEALDWKKHKLESRLLGEISKTSDTQNLLFQLTLILISERYKLKSLNFLPLPCHYPENCLRLPFTWPFLRKQDIQDVQIYPLSSTSSRTWLHEEQFPFCTCQPMNSLFFLL